MDNDSNNDTRPEGGVVSAPHVAGSAGKFVIRLNVHTGEGTTDIQKRYRFHKKRIIVGSAHSSDIRIQQKSVSNVHAVIEMDTEGKVQIYDMASESGVQLNDEKVTTAALSAGDSIRIGSTTIDFDVEELGEITKNIPLPSAMRTSGEQRLYFQEDEDFSPLIIEDERNVINIFDYPDDEVALQVAIYWGDTILDIQHHVDKEAIWIGQDSGVDLVVPEIPSAFPFITMENNDQVLHFTEDMSGVIRSGSNIEDVEEIKDRLRSSPSGLHRTIRGNDLVKLHIEDITIFVSYTPAPPHVRKRKFFEKDALFFKFFTLSLALTTAAIIAAVNVEKPEKLEVDELPERVATTIFKPPRPVPPPKLIRKKLAKKLPTKVKAKQKPKPKPKPMVKPMPKPMARPMPMTMMRTMPTVMPMANPTKSQMAKTTMVRGMRAFPRMAMVSPRTKTMTRSAMAGNEGEGAMARGRQGQRGSRNSMRSGPPMNRRAMRSRSAMGGGARARGAGGSGAVETLTKDLGGAISQALSGNRGGVRAAGGRLRGYGGFTTKGGGGLGEIGTGSGGGGKSVDVAGLGSKGIGGGKIGKGRGAIGRGGNLVGGRSRPTIEVGDSVETVILGGLDKSVIDAMIKRHLRQIRNCYESELTRGNPKIRGRVMTRFVISASGRVSRAAVTATSLKSARVERCLTGVIKRIQFPEPLGGGVVEVSYPFVFSPSK